MTGFYNEVLFQMHRMFPLYLEEVQETGKIPDFIPSPLNGAEEAIKRIFEVVLSPGYVQEIEPGRWALTPKGQQVIRGAKPGASEYDRHVWRNATH